MDTNSKPSHKGQDKKGQQGQSAQQHQKPGSASGKGTIPPTAAKTSQN